MKSVRLGQGLIGRMRFWNLILLAFLPVSPSWGMQTPPNIVVIMADDLGFGDLSCYGATTFSTPEIDRLAQAGRRFTNAHSSASTCTPTRFSLMTGMYAFRRKGTGIAPPNSPALLPPDTMTLAKVLQAAGYRTGMVGKWHLGLGGPTGPDWNGVIAPGPLEAGFDECLILPTTNDRVPQVLIENHFVRGLDPADPLWVGMQSPAPDHISGLNRRETLRMDWDVGHNGTIHNGISRIGYFTGGQSARYRDEDLADEWSKAIQRFFDTHRNQPFFLFFASHNLHVPRAPHERFIGKTPHGPRGDCIAELDWTVGEIRRLLTAFELQDKTLIIFCSDNGPVLNDGYQDQAVEKNGDHRPAGPFRGGKTTVFEGGTRTPFIATWPGRIHSSVSDALVCTIDLPATLVALAIPNGTAAPDFPDSQNLLPAILGTPDQAGRNHLVTQDNQGDKLAYREGNWKLIRTSNPKRLPDDPQKYRFELYDLDLDPGEAQDLSQQAPNQVQLLNERLERILHAGK